MIGKRWEVVIQIVMSTYLTWLQLHTDGQQHFFLKNGECIVLEDYQSHQDDSALVQ